MSQAESNFKLAASAKAAFEDKKYSEAARIFHQILSSLDPNRTPLEVAEVRNNLSVVYLKDGQAQAAYDQALGTDRVFADHNETEKQAMSLGNIAAALVELGRLDEALDYYQQSSALFQQCGNREMRGFVLREISTLQMRRGKQIESLFAMDAALQTKPDLSWRERILKNLMATVHRLLNTR